jgi:hypothetical protein
LLAGGADPLAMDELGRTPSHLACEEGRDGALEVLRWDKARREWSKALSLPDGHGLTPGHLAAVFAQPRCLELLLFSNVADAPSESGRSALHWACIGGNKTCIELLKDRGASVEAVDALGLRPADYLLARLPPGLEGPGRTADAAAEASELRPLLSVELERGSVEIWRRPGYSLEPVFGLELVVWPDGLVLFAPDRSRPGADLRVGRVAVTALERALSVCTELGLFDRPWRSEVGMHASSTSVKLRRAAEAWTKFEWDGQLADPSGWYPRSSRRSFVNAWLLMESQLRSLVPSTSLALHDLDEAGELRGYRGK